MTLSIFSCVVGEFWMFPSTASNNFRHKCNVIFHKKEFDRDSDSIRWFSGMKKCWRLKEVLVLCLHRTITGWLQCWGWCTVVERLQSGSQKIIFISLACSDLNPLKGFLLCKDFFFGQGMIQWMSFNLLGFLVFFSFYWINDLSILTFMENPSRIIEDCQEFYLWKKKCSSWIFLWTSHWKITELQKHSSCSENCHMRFRLRSFQKICQTHLILF